MLIELVLGHGIRRTWIRHRTCQRPDMFETTFFDLFHVRHQLWVHFGAEGKTLDEEYSLPSALGCWSVDVGVLAMVGGQTIVARAFMEGLLSIFFLITGRADYGPSRHCLQRKQIDTNPSRS